MNLDFNIISENTLQYVEKYIEEDECFRIIREKVQRAIDTSPKLVSFEEAKKQVEKSLKNK